MIFLVNSFLNNDFFRAAVEIKFWRQFWPTMNQSDEFNYRKSFLITSENKIQKCAASAGKLRIKLMNMKILSLYQSIIFHRHNFLYPSFNKKFEQLRPSGLLKLMNYGTLRSSEMYGMQNKQKEGEKAGHIVLSMERLSVGFLIWIVMLSLAFCIFATNFITYWSPKIWHMWLLGCTLNCYYKAIRNH